MSMSDPIADFLTHIRNATMRRHPVVESPFSRLKSEVAEVLRKEGFIEGWSTVQPEQGHRRIRVNLKYDEKGVSVIRQLKRISKPGLRRYLGYESLKPVLKGQGIAVVSTSKGVISDLECRRDHIGGEVICQVW